MTLTHRKQAKTLCDGGPRKINAPLPLQYSLEQKTEICYNYFIIKTPFIVLCEEVVYEIYHRRNPPARCYL